MNGWTPTRVAELRKHVDDGLSGRETGIRMGMTRCKVMGKAYRLGIHFKSAPSTEERVRVKHERTGQPSPPRPIRSAPAIDDVARLQCHELGAHTCHWPIGEPATEAFGFCGLPARPDKPYCLAHCARAYRETPPARDGGPSRRRAA